MSSHEHAGVIASPGLHGAGEHAGVIAPPGSHGAGEHAHIPHGHEVAAHGPVHGEHIHLPRPTGWPITVAFGFTLLVGGLLLQYVISILGGILIIVGCVGWFRDVLPSEAHEMIPVEVQEIEVASSRRTVARIEVTEEHRAHVPAYTFSVWAGVKGGILGGIAMIIPAILYGIVAQHSIWFPVNLLGGVGVTGWTHTSMLDLRAFHPAALGMAIVIQTITSLLVGLVYGSVLPLFPRHPILVGGVLAPLVWTGLLYAGLPVINPMISQHVNWAAFVISQITFGVVAGYVVSRADHVRTAQSLPFAMRAGLESPGVSGHDREEKN